MASFEQQFYLENPTRWEAFKRDVRLLLTLARHGVLWLTTGARVRRAYRRARREHRSLELDSLVDG